MHGEGDGLKRAHSLIMKVEADTRDGLIAELENVQRRILMEKMTRGTMGGYSASNIYSYCQDPEMTHDRYFQGLDDYLEKQRSAAQTGPSPNE